MVLSNRKQFAVRPIDKNGELNWYVKDGGYGAAFVQPAKLGEVIHEIDAISKQ